MILILLFLFFQLVKASNDKENINPNNFQSFSVAQNNRILVFRRRNASFFPIYFDNNPVTTVFIGVAQPPIVIPLITATRYAHSRMR